MENSKLERHPSITPLFLAAFAGLLGLCAAALTAADRLFASMAFDGVSAHHIAKIGVVSAEAVACAAIGIFCGLIALLYRTHSKLDPPITVPCFIALGAQILYTALTFIAHWKAWYFALDPVGPHGPKFVLIINGVQMLACVWACVAAITMDKKSESGEADVSSV